MSVRIERLNEKLEGEIVHGERRFGVPYALPGDLVTYHTVGRGRKRRIVTDSIEPGPYQRAEPFCEHFGRCGGCRGQHLPYEDQFATKVLPYREAMKQNFGLDPVEIIPGQTERYRNRMDFVVEGDVTGLRPAGDYRRFEDIRSCRIQRSRADEILSLMRELVLSFPGLSFRRRELTGILKYITIREGSRSGAVILTCCEEKGEQFEYIEFVKATIVLLREFESRSGYRFSLFSGESGALSEISAVPGSQLLHGDPFFEESMGPLVFQVPPDAFFQPNPEGFYRLFDLAIEAVRLRWSGGVLIDLYCGSAVLSLLLAETLGSVTEMHGADFSASGIELGEKNIAAYLATHPDRRFDFDLRTADLNRGNLEFPAADLVVLDPPRSGLSPGVLRWINEARPAPLLVYISCSPSVQVQNLIALRDNYRPIFSAVTDPFPQTTHLESAVLLERI